MKIEEVIQSNKPLSSATRTVINLMHTASIVEDLTTHVLKPHGLSLQQYNVLRILRGQEDQPANLSTIQERMVKRMSNTTRIVDKLLAKELVTREVCPTNRRKIEIKITVKGLQLLKDLDDKTEQNNSDIVATLSENDLTVLNNLLDNIRQ